MNPGDMRTIHIQYFAVLREERGCRDESVETAAETAAELFDELRERHGFTLGRDRLKVVVNEEFSDWNQPLSDGDAIVFVPPVAGGNLEENVRMFSMSPEPIDDAVLKAALRNASAGACVTFEGWVRNENEGKEVQSLEYEGYESVAVKEGQKILEDTIKKYDLIAAQCVHRVGHLQLGEMAVWVGVSAGHRDEAFKACRHVIDEIKHRLPIWKKEYYADGDSGWINCQVEAEADKHH